MANKNPVQTKQFRDSQGRFARVDKETIRKAQRKGTETKRRRAQEQKTIAEICRAIDEMPMKSKFFAEGLRNLGIDEETIKQLDQKAAGLWALKRKVLTGDAKAIELWLKLTGEYEETRNINITGMPLSDGVVSFTANDDE